MIYRLPYNEIIRAYGLAKSDDRLVECGSVSWDITPFVGDSFDLHRFSFLDSVRIATGFISQEIKKQGQMPQDTAWIKTGTLGARILRSLPQMVIEEGSIPTNDINCIGYLACLHNPVNDIVVFEDYEMDKNEFIVGAKNFTCTRQNTNTS